MRKCGATSISVTKRYQRHTLYMKSHTRLPAPIFSLNIIPRENRQRFLQSYSPIPREEPHSVYCVLTKLKESLLCSFNEVLYENTAVKLSSTLLSHISKVGSVSYQQRYNQVWSLVMFLLRHWGNVLHVLRKTWSDNTHCVSFVLEFVRT